MNPREWALYVLTPLFTHGQPGRQGGEGFRARDWVSSRGQIFTEKEGWSMEKEEY